MILSGFPPCSRKNRDRLLTTEMSRKVMAAILAHREVAPLLSDEHFSVDGTLVKAWASMKSFQPKAADTPPDDDPGSPPVPTPPPRITPNRPNPRQTPCHAPAARTAMPRSNFRGEKRSNVTHCLDHRPRRAALQEVARNRGDAVLHWPCADGEPLGPDRAGVISPGPTVMRKGAPPST